MYDPPPQHNKKCVRTSAVVAYLRVVSIQDKKTSTPRTWYTRKIRPSCRATSTYNVQTWLLSRRRPPMYYDTQPIPKTYYRLPGFFHVRVQYRDTCLRNASMRDEGFDRRVRPPKRQRYPSQRYRPTTIRFP